MAAAALTSAATRSLLRSPIARQVLQAGQQNVIPRFWTGEYDVVDQSRYVVDGGGLVGKEDLHSDSAIGQEMREKYDDVGLVHLTNTGLTDMSDQRLLARILMGEETEYEGGANARGRNEELGNVYDIGAPLSAALAYHHEVTYKAHSVESLGFLCKHAVQNPMAGATFVSDSVQAHDYIMQTKLGQKLKEKGLCFLRRMTDAEAPAGSEANGAVYNHWQTSWMTNDPDEAVVAANKQGLEVEWVEDAQNGRIMLTKYYKSAFEYVPFLDRNIMVTSIADDGEWFDSWPGIMHVPQELRPLEMLFGDGEPFTLEEKQEWTDAYDLFGVPIPWKAGDVAVICNYRFAHGRPGIEVPSGEKRELGVMLGRFFERIETKEDKW
jgi:hypothetical protein